MDNQNLKSKAHNVPYCNNIAFQRSIIQSLEHDNTIPGNELLEKFIQSFYSYIPIDYIHEYDLTFFKGVALNAYNFLLNKPKKKQYLVSVMQCDESSNSAPFIELKIVNVDTAFIIDSIKYLLDRIGLEPFFFVYPIIATKRTSAGKLVDVLPVTQYYTKTNSNNTSAESLILCRIYGSFDKKFLEDTKKQIITILEQVNKTSADWQPILNEIEQIIQDLSTSNDTDDLLIVNFCQWLKANNFTFLSCINYDLVTKSTSLIAGHQIFFPEQDIQNIVMLACDNNNSTKPILVGKINKISPIHKNSFISYVLIKQKSAKGMFSSVKIFLGLYSSSTRQQSVYNIPILLNKLNNILEFSKFVRGSYNEKKFCSIFESMPREILFEVNEEKLYCAGLGVLSAMHSSLLRLCLFTNYINKIIDIIIFLPSSRLTPDVYSSITNYLIKTFNTKILSSELNTIPPDFCNIYISMSVEEALPDSINIKEIESNLEILSAQWVDSLKASLIKSYGLFEGLKLFKDYSRVFSRSYTQNFSPSEAIEDLKYIMHAQTTGKQAFNFIIYSPSIYSLKIYNPGSKLLLSQIFPLVENLNFNILDEKTFRISVENSSTPISQMMLDSDSKQEAANGIFASGQDINSLYFSLSNQSDTWIYNLNLSPQIEMQNFDAKTLKYNIETALEKIATEGLECDALYKLITLIGINVNQVRILQALVHYLQQVKFAYSRDYIKLLLITYYQFTALILRLFDLQFNPHTANDADVATSISAIEEQLQQSFNAINNSTEDKILRTIFILVKSISRTNYYQLNQNGEHKDYLSFKIRSSLLRDLPLPRPIPYAEIFVFASEFEGIHLRGGKVARGGLRWSDRGEDYRTEVLGLMKAQTTKNTVIVPVGAKGGFFVKQSAENAGADYWQLGIKCYRNFLRGLLDITDNIVNNKTVSPKNVHIHNDDHDDSYLVVAADKGTASFSDHANQVAQKEYNFWLGDAFASGGSAGYDHKKMGITAKGAWISVQHHFHSLSIDVQKDPITIVGIGDMSGDVFGNGLLRSSAVKLVAAFNHMHIFIDPNPDPQSSYKERQRLFKLQKSKWSDYDPKVLSQGGGIYSRAVKVINISHEAQQLLGLNKNELTPEELIRAILKAQVDLIWNGGIGTYIKASDESSFEVGDKSNDMLRCNAKDISAKVIAEGGNLGVSQRGRIEYAKHGGRINTDFIDNSAGVACSDREVNIKIALNSAIVHKKLSLKERNKILEQMALDVERLVLIDNYKQNQAITITEKSFLFTIDIFTHLIKVLEQSGLLDRSVEFLPSDNELARRSIAREKMTRPELAVLLSYSKMHIYSELIKTDLANESFLDKYLLSYFPELMQKRFREEILSHTLRKEIILTILSNQIVNQLSGPIINMIQNDMRVSFDQILKAYVITNEIFGVDQLWQNVEALQDTIDIEIQIAIFSEINKLLRRCISWLVKHIANLDINETINSYRSKICALAKKIPTLLSNSVAEKVKDKFEYYTANNVPQKLAPYLSNIDYLVSIMDIVLVAADNNLDCNRVAKAYFSLGEILHLDWLRKCCDRLISDHYWNRLAIQSLKDDLYDKQRKLLTRIFGAKKNINFDRWWHQNYNNAHLYLELIHEISIHKSAVDLNMIVLANKKLETFLNKV